MANQTLSTRLNVGPTNIVIPGTSAGLVSSSGLTANTTGSAIASGYVGYILPSSSSASLSAGTYANCSGSITLTSGNWVITGNGVFSISGAASNFSWRLNVNGVGGSTTGIDLGSNQNPTTAGDNFPAGCLVKFITVPASTTYVVYFDMKVATIGSGAVTGEGGIQAMQTA